MYRDFFGFKLSPFNITPDPRFIFLSKNHREAFAHLLYGIQQHSGFIAVIGEVGSGKTTMLRALLNQLGEEHYRIALIFNPCLSAHELLASINREYGLPADNLSIAQLVSELNRFLLRENEAGRTVVLVIDEAQNLEPRVLEQIRLVSNLETESDKLIQIVLAGQPELSRLLADPQLRQLSQRITVRYHLLPMDFADTCAYINHRMELAGGWRAATFEDGALKKIYRYSGGLPRLINVVCDRALLIAFTDESRTVTPRMAATAIREISKGAQRLPAVSWKKRAAWAAAAALMAGAALYAFPSREKIAKPAPPVPVQAVKAAPLQAQPRPLPDEVKKAMSAGLAGVSEAESGARAFNSLGRLWNIKDVRPTPAGTERQLEVAAIASGLKLTLFQGPLDLLADSGYPAMLKITVPGVPGERYVAMTAVKNDRITLEIPGGTEIVLARAELKSVWGGRGLLLWRNFLDIPPLSIPNTKGEHVRLVQLLLQKTGHYGGRLNGIYDGGTVEALKAFQSSRGLAADGRIDDRTLPLLYGQAGGFAIPGPPGKQRGQSA